MADDRAKKNKPKADGRSKRAVKPSQANKLKLWRWMGGKSK